jgi:hypothetical protein
MVENFTQKSKSNLAWIVSESSRLSNGNGKQGSFLQRSGWWIFFFGKLTYVLKEEDTNIIRGIPQIYNDNRNIKQQMATG